MNKSILEKLDELGYKIKKREFESQSILQCSAPGEDKEFQLRGFGIEILDNAYVLWDGRKLKTA